MTTCHLTDTCHLTHSVSLTPPTTYHLTLDPDRTTSETPYFCYSHLLAKFNIGPKDPTNTQKPDLDALRSAGTDQQDAQLSPDYYDVSPQPRRPLCRP